MKRPLRIVKNNYGFTLIEALLVVAIISIITIITAPIFLSMQSNNELDVATNTVAQYLYQAQSNSRNQSHDCSWGVTINSTVLTLFCGDSYSSRNPNFDNIFEISDYVEIHQNVEIVFSKFTGLPQTTGSYILATNNGQLNTVAINSKGVVQY